jgi:hypothetical protein
MAHAQRSIDGVVVLVTVRHEHRLPEARRFLAKHRLKRFP